MGKAAAKKPVTTTPAVDPIQQTLDATAVQTAKSQLMVSMMGMGWRLAIAVLVPIVVGVKLDSRYGTKPSYALTGFILAIALASYMIYSEFQEIQAEQQRESQTTSKRRKKGNS